ncbi:MAG: hypothetical protein ABSC06_30020 [Rhodopila sp.]
MTALAQGSAGVALVMCFALLRSGQVDVAAILLAVQSAAVAMAAIVLHQPLMAIPPVVLGAGFWLVPTFPLHRSEAPSLGSALAPCWSFFVSRKARWRCQRRSCCCRFSSQRPEPTL